MISAHTESEVKTMRLIDADALAAHMFHGYGTEITPVDIDAETYKLGWNDAIEAIMDNAPTIEPEQCTGEWVDFSMSIKGVPTEACGVCGEWSLGMGKNYCPNCGADMRNNGDD